MANGLSPHRATAEPGWLAAAAAAARALTSPSTGRRGARHHVYVALLHDPARGGRFGLYVGQTALDPDLRFDQHKTGYKASRAARRFGARLLPGLVQHLNPLSEAESRRLEAALAAAFRAAGISWVEGGH